MRRHITALILILYCFASIAQNKQKQQVIFDTDMGPDYDDVGAIAMLHTMSDNHEVDILATISCNHHYLTGPTLDLLNTYFKRPQIPIGVPKGLGISITAWQKWPHLLIKNYPYKFQSNDELPDATTVYRELLSRAKDSSVVIVAVGFLTNLSNLLHSKKDRFSDLSGYDLVIKKVKHVVSMAGRFPEGREYNIYKDTVAAIDVVNNWPTKIIWSGWEIGNEIRTGLKLISNKQLNSSPVKDVFSLAIPMAKGDSLGRMSWDQTAVLVGVRGLAPFFNTRRGRMLISTNGKNYWQENQNGKHYYLTKKMDFDKVSDIIESLMMR
ncbi:nucleoside hydrolase [Desertivirga xinjiangensis]|uniref:nucleoside hydrolase n=1 Tax=Desertivirga xinjiangensis TaxID=539206 RepID=UPI00210EC165|nr:nucleoside hydrolase [Pedobacter xinjiangensis]